MSLFGFFKQKISAAEVALFAVLLVWQRDDDSLVEWLAALGALPPHRIREELLLVRIVAAQATLTETFRTRPKLRLRISSFFIAFGRWMADPSTATSEEVASQTYQFFINEFAKWQRNNPAEAERVAALRGVVRPFAELVARHKEYTSGIGGRTDLQWWLSVVSLAAATATGSQRDPVAFLGIQVECSLVHKLLTDSLVRMRVVE